MSDMTSSDTTTSPDTEKVKYSSPSPEVKPKKDLKFWLIFASMCLCLFLSALEVTSISTALPTIAHDLHTSQFVWVGSAYALSSTAYLPLSGGLAQTFGRRPAILLTIGLFALGSAICGSAKTINVLILGRTIQGIGGGGNQSLTGIVLADLVTLQERGAYAGLYGLTWCFAASIGPLVGGSLAAEGQWRWIFYLNLPIALIAAVSVVLLLDLPTPPGTYRYKLGNIDWIGNFLVMSSTVAYTIGLTWGGVTAPWDSATVLVPLVLGLVGLGVFIAYDGTLAASPLVPFSLLTNMTSISGYIQSFCTSVILMATMYFFPVYFQACKGVSPVTSGVYMLPFCSLALAALLTGFSVKITGRYRPQMWIGWVFGTVALGMMSSISATDALSHSLGFLLLLGWSTGILNATIMYPVQAPLPVTQNAPALAFMWFIRSFGTVWGITVGSAVLQNELSKRLPASFTQSVPEGTAIAYALIPELSTLSVEMRSEVRVAFAGSLAVLWRVLAAVSGAGLLASLCMKGLSLCNRLDADWAIAERGRSSLDKGERGEETHTESSEKGEETRTPSLNEERGKSLSLDKEEEADESEELDKALAFMASRLEAFLAI